MGLRAILSLVVAAGCHHAPTVAPQDTVRTSSATVSTEKPPLGGCATLVGYEEPDVVRVGRDGLVYYANEQVGLSVVDVSDEPKLIATSRFTGTPLGVFERERGAIVVYAPWDRVGETVIRAVSTTRRETGFTLAELTLRGAPRDARGVGDAVIVTREEGGIIVGSFKLESGGLVQHDEVRLYGAGAVVGGSPWGLAVARSSGERTAVTWLDVDSSQGLVVGATAFVPGIVPRWKDHAIDVAEDAHVRVFGCATSGCGVDEAASYAAIDFGSTTTPRVLGSATIPRSAASAFAFLPNGLVVARHPATESADATELSFFRGEVAPVKAGAVRVNGTVGSISVAGNAVIATGWTGSATAGKRAVLHHIDVGARPRLVGSVAFGGDWTWSPAYDDVRALSVDPRSTFAALPMTTLRGSSGPLSLVQVFALDSHGPRTWSEREAVADRLVFIDGKLVAFGADGVSTVPLDVEGR